jgi:uncharacterized membrane protein YkoI
MPWSSRELREQLRHTSLEVNGNRRGRPSLHRRSALPKLNEPGRRAVRVFMKKKYHLVCALGLTTLFATPSSFAAPGEADLMRQAKISKAQAEKIALTKVPQGKVRGAELENERHALVWSFDIGKSGSRNITEVLVNAKTGKIISVSTETPVDQAKETAADQATSKH